MKEVIHSERGGICVGDHNDYLNCFVATWPSAKITIRQDYLEISYPIKRKIHFKKEDIKSIQWYSRNLLGGVAFIHTIKDVPPLVLFNNFRRKRLMSILKENGWPVKE